MKIIHFSDTHLGYSSYTKVDSETDINQRELDVYKTFNQVIEYILEVRPDLIIHSGDLFDTPRPKNRAIAEAIVAFSRVSNAGIPLVIISGNHSTPRIASTGSIFESFKVFPNLYPVYKGAYEKVIIGDAAVHCVPHCFSYEDAIRNIKMIKADKNARFNIAVLHAGLTADEVLKIGEFNEIIIPGSTLDALSGLDYIALGHYHKFIKVKDAGNSFFCGSTERFSITEEGYQKGFLEFELPMEKTPRLVPLDSRDIVKIEGVDCKGLNQEDVLAKIKDVLPEDINGKIVIIKIINVNRAVAQGIDFIKDEFESLTKDAFKAELRVLREEEKGEREVTDTGIGPINVEFEKFLAGKKLDKKDLEEIMSLGARYIEQCMDKFGE